MKKALPYIVNFAVCAVIFVAVIFIRGIAKTESAVGVMRCLSDGFFIAGIVSLAGGAFTLIGRQGLLDAFIFTCKKIWVSLHNREYREKNRMTYAEYRENKKEKTSSYAHLWIIGGIFVILGVLFTVLFYTI